MCISLFYVLYYSLLEGVGGGIQILNVTDKNNFTDWISFLTSNVMVETNPSPEALSAAFYQHRIVEKT